MWCVLGGVLLSRTLAGAVPSALSGLASGFGMDAGRFPVAVPTETTTWAVRCGRRGVRLSGTTLFGYPYDCPLQRTLCVVGGWVGCGPYSGRLAHAYSCSPLGFPRTLCVWCVGVLLFVLAY